MKEKNGQFKNLTFDINDCHMLMIFIYIFTILPHPMRSKVLLKARLLSIKQRNKVIHYRY